MIKAKKSLGQNFLTDADVARRIVNVVSPLPSDVVIEIGPGTGALTHLLVERSGHVTAIEIDSLLADELRLLSKAENLSVRTADALSVDWPGLISDARAKLLIGGLATESITRVRIVANLPYYISTPILEVLLSLGSSVYDMTLMLQKEVADRITTGPGSRDYGSLSVMVQFYCVATRLFDVPPLAFTPSPRVQSALIKLTIRERPPVEVGDEGRFFKLVRAAFAQRRKTILNNLRAAEGIMHFEKAPEAALEAALVAPQRRAETLSLSEFAALYRELTEDHKRLGT